MLKRFIYILPLIYGSTAVAQDTISTINGKLNMAPVRNPWISSQNAAGLSVLPMPGMGRTYFKGSIEDGELRRPQQASTSRNMSFVSERYQSLMNASLYGKFTFNQLWDDDIRMSGNLDPYRRNPYQVGDSIGGDWKKQLYDLQLKAAMPLNQQRSLLVGLGLQYKVGTGARQNDPRPLNYFNELDLHPSIIWAMNKNWTVGLNGKFNSYKENLGYAVSNNEDIHYLYRLAGLGYYYRNQGVGIDRFYKGETWGAGGQIQFEKENFRFLLDGGYAIRNENAQDGDVIPVWYGRFREKQYHLSGNATLLTGSFTHQWEAAWKTFDGDGKDYHYGRVDKLGDIPLVNSDILSGTFYNEGSFHYRWIKDRFQDDYKWMLDASVLYSGMDNRYYHPRSRHTVDANEYRLAFTRNLAFSDKRNFIWGAHIGLRDCFNSFNDFQSSGFQTDIVVNQLVKPDQEWLSSDIFKAGISMEYRFSVSHSSETAFFVKAEGSIWKRVNNASLPNASRQFAGLTIGMTY